MSQNSRFDMIRVKYIIFLVSTSIIISCSFQSKKDRVEENKKLISKDESFEEFYEKFHSDSLFQISRIKFPLEGYNISEDYSPLESNDDFTWSLSMWRMQYNPKMDTNLIICYKKNANKIQETIYIENSGFEINRIFIKTNTKWYLTFYGNQDL